MAIHEGLKGGLFKMAGQHISKTRKSTAKGLAWGIS